MFGKRAALVWLVLEPAAHIAFMVFVMSVLRLRHIGGIDTALWLMTGMLAFFLFRRVASQGAAAIDANMALFTYRQVKPVDTVIVRCVLEALLMAIIAAAMLGIAALLGVPMQLASPLIVIGAVAGLWLLGLGYALCVSVANQLAPEVGNIIGLLLVPLYLLSGVIFPIAAIPYPWREWILYNPVAHGVEAVRVGLSDYYHAARETDLAYLYGFALVLIFLGLALQVRHRRRLVAQ
ncbi:ABC transporter [Ramlibacter rhizophilus]|uniref:Transport permease protein n=2 Tax=Ramlibacter rhizophilus TaxID=1781167 RepID=A0A4Z0BNP0_9BURK|nr:ABC transporter [Ramlibacter rhizophilus]